MDMLPLVLDYEGTEISCPIGENTVMVPINTICKIIEVKFDRQHEWLKEHRNFSKLYRQFEVVTADGKKREAYCLSMLDALVWLSSINSKNRRVESIEKQDAFFWYFREQYLLNHKNLQGLKKEYERELQLIKQQEETETSILNLNNKLKEKKAELKQIVSSLEEVRINKFTGQISMPFDE